MDALVDLDFAKTLGLGISGSSGFLELPNRKRARTLGVAKGIFSFSGEAIHTN